MVYYDQIFSYDLLCTTDEASVENINENADSTERLHFKHSGYIGKVRNSYCIITFFFNAYSPYRFSSFQRKSLISTRHKRLTFQPVLVAKV